MQRPIAIIGLYADIARLRRGPEDLPASSTLLLLTIVAYAGLDALLLSVAPGLPGNPALLIGIDIGVTLVWYAMLLRIAHKPERYLQTVTAVLGFQLVLAPLLIASGWLFLKFQADTTWQLPVALVRLAVEVWALIVPVAHPAFGYRLADVRVRGAVHRPGADYPVAGVGRRSRRRGGDLMHVHILGICGTFMGGIAAIARAAGHRVTGSDRNVYPPMSTQLEALGIEITEGFEAAQLDRRARTWSWSAT